MAQIDHTTQILQIIQLVVDGILDTTVQVDSEHTLRTSTYTACPKRIAETIVGNLITQTAATRQ